MTVKPAPGLRPRFHRPPENTTLAARRKIETPLSPPPREPIPPNPHLVRAATKVLRPRRNGRGRECGQDGSPAAERFAACAAWAALCLRSPGTEPWYPEALPTSREPSPFLRA